MIEIEGDVVIRYSFLPTESSIRESAEKVVAGVNKQFRNVNLGGTTGATKSGKPVLSSLERSILELSRVFSGNREIGTRLQSARKLQGGESGGGLKEVIGLLGVISVATMVVGAFFEAVGPIIKVVMKALSMVILILLMPILRLLLPALPGLIKALIGMAQFLSGGLQGIIDGAAMALKAIGEFFSDPLGTLKNIAIGVSTWLIDNVPKFISGLLDLGKNILSWVVENLPTIFLAMFGLGPAILVWIVTNLPFILDKVFQIGEKILDWIVTNLPIALANLLNLGNTIFDFVTAALAKGFDVLNRLGQWIKDEIIKVVTGGGSASGTNLANQFKLATDAGNIVGSFLKSLTPAINQYNQSKGPVAPTGQYAVQGDFISRPGGGVIPFSPGDTVIGVKNPGALGGTTINNYITVDAGVDASKLEAIFKKFARDQGRELRMRTSYVSGVYS